MVLLALNRNEMTGLGLCSLINLRVGKGETPFEPTPIQKTLPGEA